MRKLLLTVLTLFAIGFMIGCSNDTDDNATEDTKSETITFGVTPWTSTEPPTKVASLILQDMGYEVEEIESDAGGVYAGLSRGDLDVFMDSWFPNQKHYVEEYSDNIEDIAVSYDNADSGLVVPEYMEDINDVGDLKGKEDLFDNEAYTIEEGDPAMENLDKMIDQYGLDIEQVNSSEGAMLAAALKKMEKEEPVLFYGWRPHTMFNKYDVKILTNEEVTEFFSGSSINVVINKELKESSPEVYNFLKNWSIPLEDVEAMIAAIDDGEDSEELAREWIEQNEDKVQEMIGE